MSEQDKINEKYKSAKPTEKAIDGWQDEMLAYHTSPEGLALRKLTSERYASPGNAAWDEQPDYIKAITDRQSFVNATIQSEQERATRQGTSAGNWENYSGFTKTERENLQKKIDNPRTKDTERAKAQKKLNEDRAIAEGAAKRQSDKYSKTADERRQELEAEFDRTAAELKTESQKIKAEINKGDSKTIQAQLEYVLRPLDSYRDRNSDTNALDTRSRQRQIIKDHLIAESKRETPEKVLGVKPGASIQDVKQAYRKAAQVAHPDAGGNADDFQRVNDAFKKLRQKLDFAEFVELDIEVTELDPNTP
jgi:DnaJ-domain-containing protein 1